MSRTGLCFEWEGCWSINQDPLGCGAVTSSSSTSAAVVPIRPHQIANYSVRAVIVAEEFFGIRGSCHMNGRVRGNTIRGLEVCAGSADQFPIVIYLTPDAR